MDHSVLPRRERANQSPAHLLRRCLDLSDRIELFKDVSHHPLALVNVCEFATAENDRDDHLVLVLQKALRLRNLELDVVLARLGTQAYFLDFGLMDVRLVLFFLLLVLELAEIHDSADGRFLVGGHLHKIQAGFPRERERLFGGDDAELSALGRDDADRRDADLLVDAVLLLDGSRLRTRTRSAGREEARLFAGRQRHSSGKNPKDRGDRQHLAETPGEGDEYSSGRGGQSRQGVF